MTNNSEDLVRHKEGAIVPGEDLVLCNRGGRLRWLKASTVISKQSDLIEQLEREKDDETRNANRWAEKYDTANAEADTLARGFNLLADFMDGESRFMWSSEIQKAATIASRRVNGE